MKVMGTINKEYLSSEKCTRTALVKRLRFLHARNFLLPSSADGTVIAISSMTCGSTGEAGEALPLGTGEQNKLSGCSRTTPYHDRDAAWQNHNDGTEEGAAPAYSRWGFTQRLIPARTSTPRTSFT